MSSVVIDINFRGIKLKLIENLRSEISDNLRYASGKAQGKKYNEMQGIVIG